MGISSNTKKNLARTYYYCDADTGWIINPCTRFSRSTIHLHFVLVKEKYVENAVDALLKGEDIKVKETRAIGCSIKV